MELAHLVAFNLTLLAALASPGPAMLLSIRMSISGGFRAGAATGLGLATMAASWTTLALLGLTGLFQLVPWAYGVMKLVGAVYLLWLAWGIWRDAATPLDTETAPVKRAFLGGLLVNLANPKSVLFASAVLLVIFPAGLTLTEKSLIVANHLAVELIAYTGFAALLSTPPARAAYLRAKSGLDRAAATVLGALGLRLLWERSA
ncbi:LysE family translocator [Poseidonocella sedimentorum]|uniref:Threonine/homoserine/homoserine lactone efflux protein n=1 Tax=Poseidonocella sedimentorum TaxID=871652 RepID=A0A1I6DFA7_9RHOB|nr:LysE family transporter [Poseidonocella sedimentorum]SFR04114.1 Threonine/homoserine/homoserine lactone efflux protein [Poseidonocella sedimentorum]